jgi:hypothetical protein
MRFQQGRKGSSMSLSAFYNDVRHHTNFICQDAHHSASIKHSAGAVPLIGHPIHGVAIRRYMLICDGCKTLALQEHAHSPLKELFQKTI